MAEMVNDGGKNPFRPTLLVGLGGVGCEIAAAVLEMAEKNGMLKRCRVAILGFDTDENDIRKMLSARRMPSRNLIRTSPMRTVGEVLLGYRNEVESWFVPFDSLTTEIRQMSLHNGAGQVRMLSRLAFYSELKNAATRNRLTRAFDAITRSSGSPDLPAFQGLVNVLFVGTLAGGTGSGMFLQAALYINQLLVGKGCQPDIRGLFLLPDVMVSAANLQANQIEPVRANGYAALRELHGILLQTADRSPVQVEFVFAPGKKLKKDGLPFKSITLIDYENQGGGTLDGGLPSYINLASLAAYELLLTPIGGRAASAGVNDVRTKLAAAAQGDVNYYSGVGTSAVVYPTGEVLDYLSLRYASRILSDEWLLLDRRYRDALRRYEERRAARVSSERRPERASSYVRDLDQAALEGIPFFSDVRSSVHRTSEDSSGKTIHEHRQETYLHALQDEILLAFWARNKDLKKIYDSEPVPEKSDFSDIYGVQNDVYSREATLRKWKSLLQEALRAYPVEIFRNLFVFSETTKSSEWKTHHIQAYIQHEKVHPVEARYFLYSLLALIEERRKALKEKEMAEEAAMRRHGDRFDVPQTKSKETAVDRIEALMRKPRWKTLLFREISKFGQDYRWYFNESLKTMRSLTESKLLLQVYDLLEKQVRELVGVFEGFFDGLEDLYFNLKAEAEKNLRQHGARFAASGGNVYVYADARAKQEIEKGLGAAFSSSLDAGGVNLALVEALYTRYRLKRDDAFGRIPPFDPETLFRKEVIEGFCRKKLEQDHAGMYRFTAVEAIQKEAQLQGQDADQYLESIVDKVRVQSEIFLRLTKPDAGDSVAFWALSPDNGKRLGDMHRILGQTGTTPLVEPDFPDNELICFTMRVNLTPSDMAKLQKGSVTELTTTDRGIYREAYRDMLDAILESERLNPGGVSGFFTPHLDKRWHLPGLFPEFTEEETEETRKWLIDAYIMALATDRFEQKKVRGKAITRYRDWTRAGMPDEYRLLVRSHDDLDVFRAFLADHRAVQSTMVCAEVWRKRLLAADEIHSASSPEESALYKGLSSPETLFRLAGLSNYRGDSEARDYAALGVRRVYENLKQFLGATCTKLASEALLEKVEQAIENQIKGIENLQQFNDAGEEAKDEILRAANGIYKRLREQWSEEIIS